MGSTEGSRHLSAGDQARKIFDRFFGNEKSGTRKSKSECRGLRQDLSTDPRLQLLGNIDHFSSATDLLLDDKTHEEFYEARSGRLLGDFYPYHVDESWHQGGYEHTRTVLKDRGKGKGGRLRVFSIWPKNGFELNFASLVRDGDGNIRFDSYERLPHRDASEIIYWDALHYRVGIPRFTAPETLKQEIDLALASGETPIKLPDPKRFIDRSRWSQMSDRERREVEYDWLKGFVVDALREAPTMYDRRLGLYSTEAAPPDSKRTERIAGYSETVPYYADALNSLFGFGTTVEEKGAYRDWPFKIDPDFDRLRGWRLKIMKTIDNSTILASKTQYVNELRQALREILQEYLAGQNLSHEVSRIIKQAINQPGAIDNRRTFQPEKYNISMSGGQTKRGSSVSTIIDSIVDKLTS